MPQKAGQAPLKGVSSFVILLKNFFTILTDIGRKIKMQKGRYAKRRTVLYSIDQNLLFTHAEAGEDLSDRSKNR